MSGRKALRDDEDPWPLRMMKKAYVDGDITLSEFETDVGRWLDTGVVDAKYVGHIPD